MSRFSKNVLHRKPFPEELELEELYDGIIGNLMICPEEHFPESFFSRPNNSSIVSLVNPQLMTSEYLINLIRERLNQKLSGSSKVEQAITRKRLVKLFSLIATTKRSLDHVDIWTFFDCVLDESFEVLKTHVAWRDAPGSARLISTIAKRSPNLKTLKLSFRFGSSKKSPQLVPMMQSLDSLHHLTSLNLSYLDGHFEQHPILALIGKSCPLLSHLHLLAYSSRPTSQYDIIALILGELATLLIGPPELIQEHPYWRYQNVNWTEGDAPSRLRVPPEFLTPLCFSLCHLEIAEHLDGQNQNPSIDPEMAAFILRHIPLLKKLKSSRLSTGTEKAIHLLHNQINEAEKVGAGTIQVDFERACRDAINSHGLALRNPREPFNRPSSTFSSTLSLTTLEYVNLSDKNIDGMLRAIRLTCPRLKDATFGEKKEDGLAPPASKRTLWDTDEHQQLQLELSKWPKLEAITFFKVSPAKIQAILNVFHKELREVSFVECSLINLADLERCTQLQSLRISSTCSLNSYENIPALSANTFLPNLKRFSSKICLGAVSALFEEKTNLTQLHLKCLHKDIKECIQENWRSLEILHLQRCSGLVDTDVVLHLMDKLDLKEIFLHRCLEDQRMDEIMRNANAYVMATPINIQFKFRYVVRCLLDPMS